MELFAKLQIVWVPLGRYVKELLLLDLVFFKLFLNAIDFDIDKIGHIVDLSFLKVGLLFQFLNLSVINLHGAFKKKGLADVGTLLARLVL